MQPVKHLGLIENILATIIFFCPNFLFFILSSFFELKLSYVFIYNFIMMFILVSSISHLKFNNEIEKK